MGGAPQADTPMLSTPRGERRLGASGGHWHGWGSAGKWQRADLLERPLVSVSLLDAKAIHGSAEASG